MDKNLEYKIYRFFLENTNYRTSYFKFYIWKKIFKYYFGDELKSDYYIRKIFLNMINDDLFIIKKNKKRNDTFKINTFGLNDEKDIGLMTFN